jgi:hypothetical protein
MVKYNLDIDSAFKVRFQIHFVPDWDFEVS